MPEPVGGGAWSGRRRTTVLLYAVVAALVANQLAFTLYIDNGVVLRDEWRFVHLIGAYREGTLTVGEMLATTNHPIKSLLVPALVLFDGVALDLRLTPLYFGAVLVAGLTVVVFLELVRRRLVRGPPAAAWPVATAVVLLSPMQVHSISYGIAVVGLLRVGVYLVTLAWLAALCRARRPGLLQVGGWAGLLLFAVAVVGSGFAVALWGAAAVVWAASRRAVPRRPPTRRHLALAGVLIAVPLLALPLIVRPDASASLGMASAGIAEPGRSLRFALRMAAATLASGGVARIPEGAVLVVGVVVVAVALLVLWRAVMRSRGTGVDPLAAGLVVYTLLALAMIALARGGSGALFVGRYLADTVLWQVATVLAVATPAPARAGPAPRHRPRARLAAAVLVLLAAVHGVELVRGWTAAPALRREFRRVASDLRHHAEFTDQELRRRLLANARQFSYVEAALPLLEKYRLNVFRDPPADEPGG